MSDSPALEFVKSQGWSYKKSTPPNIELETCPYCKKTGYTHLYMEIHGSDSGEPRRDGLHLCQRCGRSGNLYGLKEYLGIAVTRERQARPEDKLPDVDACHEALMEDEAALDYLTNGRGFSLDIIRRQRLGLTTHYFRGQGEVRAIVYPYMVNGNIVWAHYRTLPTMPLSKSVVAKAFSCPAGFDAVLYNGQVIREGIKDIVLLEGEADCIAALDKGLVNVVGVPGANISRAEWIDQLHKCVVERIYICYDADKAGQKAAQVLANRIGVEKCWRIILPHFEVTTETGTTRQGKDANEWFAQGGGTLEGFEALKQAATLFDVDGVASTQDAVQELLNDLLERGVEPKYKTQWPSQNKLVGFDEGDVIDILAPEKVGKTTYGLNLLEHMVDQYQEDGVLICLEMTRAKLARKYVCMMSDVPDNIPKDQDEAAASLKAFMDAIPVVQTKLTNRQGRLYFCYPHYKTAEDIYNLIRDCHRRYGVTWVMVDNIQRLCDTTIGNKNRTQYLSEISKMLSQIAKDLNIQMIRILQPHRIADGKMVNTNNVDGSSQIAKDCDCMITLHRDRVDAGIKEELDSVGFVQTEGTFSTQLIVNVGLSRYSIGGATTLYYDGARSKVIEGDREHLAKLLETANRNVGYEKQLAAMNVKRAVPGVSY